MKSSCIVLILAVIGIQGFGNWSGRYEGKGVYDEEYECPSIKIDVEHQEKEFMLSGVAECVFDQQTQQLELGLDNPIEIRGDELWSFSFYPQRLGQILENHIESILFSSPEWVEYFQLIKEAAESVIYKEIYQEESGKINIFYCDLKKVS